MKYTVYTSKLDSEKGRVAVPLATFDDEYEAYNYMHMRCYSHIAVTLLKQSFDRYCKGKSPMFGVSATLYAKAVK